MEKKSYDKKRRIHILPENLIFAIPEIVLIIADIVFISMVAVLNIIPLIYIFIIFV